MYKLYAAYGSNLHVEQMRYRCPGAEIYGTALLKDYELLFRGGRRGAVATVEPREGSCVPIGIWEIQQSDEKALDRYEGYPHLYGKQDLNFDGGGIIIPAMIYVMTPGHDIGTPSPYYLETIRQGYEDFGFQQSVLDKALERCDQLLTEQEERFTQSGQMFMGW